MPGPGDAAADENVTVWLLLTDPALLTDRVLLLADEGML